MALAKTNRKRRLLLGLLAVAVGCAAVAVGTLRLRASVERDLGRLRGANLLLVTLDTTRADRLGAYGHAAAETPALDALAREGVLFERCITPTAFTLPSHTSIMAGRYPASHGVRINGDVAVADAQVMLAERLEETGYRTGAFVGAFVLDGRWGLSQGFERYDDDFEIKPGESWDLARVQRPGDAVVGKALEWLGQADARPFFAWVHLYDPHTPYEPPEPYRSRFAGSLDRLYDGEIAFADTQVGRLLDFLASRGLDDDTVVVVVGDHGEGLGSHGEAEHGYFVYDYAVHVPLLARLPRTSLRGVRVAAQVRTIDLAPTLLDLLAGAAPGDVDGESLAPLLADPRRPGPEYALAESVSPSLQYGWAELASVQTPEYKYIEAPRPELYDLRDDPGETDNRLARLPEVAGRLRDALAGIRARLEAARPETEEANIDEATMQALAALGYIGGTTAPADPERALADPKDMLHLYNAVGAASGLISEKDHAGAIDRLRWVLEQDPANPQARFLLAMCYEKTDRNDEAWRILDAVLRDEPDNLRALIAMAGLLSKQGRTAEMVAICKRALAKDERNTQAYALLADSYTAVSDHAGALPYLQKAVEIQPKLTRNRNNLAACLIGLGRRAEAEAELKEILATHPKFPLASFNLGLLYEESGRLDEARAAYATEIEHHPACVPAQFNLGNLALRSGDLAAAEERMRRLTETAPDEPRPYLFLARVLLARGADPAEVLSLVERGLERARTDDVVALGNFLLADVYSRQGRRADLERALARARAAAARAGR